ncbi:MAG TPA: tetratricopeptide repeat protein [Vicinamibacteria bacterium]|nr:tetratricopeptide repeat protein [Vicinamibacteria bacterium]
MSVARVLHGLVLASLLVSPGFGGGNKFEWSTQSTEAKALITELQARIENFQLGAGTVDVARKLVAADPNFAMGVYYLSAVVPSPEAEEQLERAVELAKTASDGERRFIETMSLARANGGANFQAAIDPLEKLAEDYPDERLVQMILGQIYLGTQNGEKARSAFERAQTIGPPSQRARSFLANDDLMRGEYEKARASFESIEKELPEGAVPAPIRYGVTFSYLYQDNVDAAIESLETYLDEYRDSGAAQGFPEVFIWNSIARINLENGRLAKAMDAYEKGYESVPGSSLPEDQKQLWFGRLLHGRCRVLSKMGKHDEAWSVAENVRKMIEDGGEAAQQYLPAYHYLVGYLMLEKGETQKAVEHLKQANATDPFQTLLLARAYDRLGDDEKARSAYQSVVDSSANGLERALAFTEAKRRLAEI